MVLKTFVLKGQNLALTGLFVPSSLDSGRVPCPRFCQGGVAPPPSSDPEFVAEFPAFPFPELFPFGRELFSLGREKVTLPPGEGDDVPRKACCSCTADPSER